MFRRPMLTMVAVVCLVVLALTAYKAFSIYQMVQIFSAPKPAISISAAEAKQVLWQSRIASIGTLKALQGVDLSVEVSGTVQDIQFVSGEQVKRGQSLITLDSAVERASLATAQAALGLAQVEYARGSNLIPRQVISKSEFDRLSAERQKAQANVEQLRATLEKKQLLAPFSGTIGIRQVDVGAYLSAGTHIATLQDLSSLYVDFYVPEQQAPKLALQQDIEIKLAAYPEETFNGRISALNPKVDDSTRNLLVRATLPNPEQKLLPGMFANVEVLLPNPQAQIVVPETAVTFTLYGTSVYRIVQDPESPENGLKVERKVIQTGERRDGNVVVLAGLAAGDQVVISGQLKLDNNSAVRIEADPAQPN